VSRRAPLGAPLVAGPLLLTLGAAAGCGTPALRIAPPNPSNNVAVACARLVDHLPNQLENLNSRLVTPRSPLVHAWGDRHPVVLRCGVPTPAGYDPQSVSTAAVNGVSWFQQVHPDRVVWTAVRKSANVELTVPTSYDAQGGFLVDIGAAVAAAVP
jgi:hypothetical protein